jgi:glycosyltransferase involved in cell wall biosynthesis
MPSTDEGVPPIFCSVIIPTIGRASLTRAVNSVLNQAFPADQLEVIVVNDSGQPLAETVWQVSDRVQVIITNRRERSVARNSGAAVARGRYIWFLDDDDWILPGALEAFARLAEQAPGAVWLSGSIQVVDEQGSCLAEVNAGLAGNCLAQIMGGAWAPIQASLIATNSFFEEGGYDPSITGTEDQDICRRLAMRGDFANTPAAVACLFRGINWDTSTDYLRAPEDTRRSRDRVIEYPGSFRRMMASAHDSYWHGRVAHVYLGLAAWHLRHRRFTQCLSRTVYGLAAFLSTGHHMINRSFWQAIRADHVPGTLHFIMQALEEDSSNQDKPGVAVDSSTA